MRKLLSMAMILVMAMVAPLLVGCGSDSGSNDNFISYPNSQSKKYEKINFTQIMSLGDARASEVYGDNDTQFIEENGRKIFLLYIRPFINGVGNYYIESRTRSLGRTDLIIDYMGKRYVIELKIWRGDEYNKRGEEQLIGYLEDYKVKTGYMVSFNFNKKKQVGVKKIHFAKHTLIEAMC